MYRPPRSAARVIPEWANSAPETTVTAIPADSARWNIVGTGWTCSGGTLSRRSAPQGAAANAGN